MIIDDPECQKRDAYALEAILNDSERMLNV